MLPGFVRFMEGLLLVHWFKDVDAGRSRLLCSQWYLPVWGLFW